MLSSFIKDYFGFNQQQRNGLLVLVFISFFLLLLRITFPYFISPDKIIIRNLPLIERKLDSFNNDGKTTLTRNFSSGHKKLNLFVFNPNTVSLQQLLQLGFHEKTAKTFLKFRKKGFVFKQKSDLQKIYGISSEFYSKLEPYILIEKTIEQKNEKPQPTIKENISVKKVVRNKIDLNSADSLSLIELEGIGPSYAKRILKYRSLLGGYASVEQLKEVYGFSSELYEQVSSFFTVSTSSIKKINLNKDDFKISNKHPYLSYELTKSIFDWRKKTTINATNFKDILNDPVLYQKLLPYIVFD